MKRFISSMIAFGLFIGMCQNMSLAQDTDVATLAEKNQASFDMVWERIRDTHWDVDLNGVDWEAAKEELRPSLTEAEDTQEVRKRISKLVQKLGQSHFDVIPESFYDTEEKEAQKPGWSGIEIRLIQAQPVITKVVEDSPADRAGVKPGSRIVEINGKPSSDLMKIESEVEIREEIKATAIQRKIDGLLQGEPNDKNALTLESAEGEEYEVEVVSIENPSPLVEFGNLPKMPLEIEAQLLEGNIGYFRFTSFFDPPNLVTKFGEFVTNHPNAVGLIVDVRGNPGGIGALSGAMTGWIAKDKQDSLGTMTTRTSEINFVYFKRPKSFEGPVVILIDELSASTSEIFAGGLQDIGRCQIVGRKSPGFALPSMVEKLPNGDRFIHAFANFQLPSGAEVEGKGVTPDITVQLDAKQIAAGVDQDIAAARQWILDQPVE